MTSATYRCDGAPHQRDCDWTGPASFSPDPDADPDVPWCPRCGGKAVEIKRPTAITAAMDQLQAMLDRPSPASPSPGDGPGVDLAGAREAAKVHLDDYANAHDGRGCVACLMARAILACVPATIGAAIRSLPDVTPPAAVREGEGVADLTAEEFESLATDVTGWCQDGDRYRVDPDEYNTVEWIDTDGGEAVTFAEVHADEGAPFLARLLNVAPRLIAEVRQWRSDCGDGVEKLIERWSREGAKPFCAHCGGSFPVADGVMAAHVAKCEHNPNVQTIATQAARIAALEEALGAAEAEIVRLSAPPCDHDTVNGLADALRARRLVDRRPQFRESAVAIARDVLRAALAPTATEETEP